MPSRLPVIGVRLEPELYRRVEAVARAEGRSLSNYVSWLLLRAHPPGGQVYGPPDSPAAVAASEAVALAPARSPSQNGPCPCGSGKKYKRCCGRTKSLVSRDTK